MQDNSFASIGEANSLIRRNKNEDLTLPYLEHLIA
mgnify:CR=1 FL=1